MDTTKLNQFSNNRAENNIDSKYGYMQNRRSVNLGSHQ